ncbi:hypothetical protein QTP86_017965 [Hemibagrus guttatus]|nr:hypothetical protein QTP86_017965 [Hemibagrus guttatus]
MPCSHQPVVLPPPDYLITHRPWDFCPHHTSCSPHQSGNSSRCWSSHISFLSGAHIACQLDHFYVTRYSIIDKHRAEVKNEHKNAAMENQWVKDYLTEYAESFPQVSILLEANIDRCIQGQKGFEDHTFKEMWELYHQYSTFKNGPELLTDEQRETIQKAPTSVRRWLHTPLTHIISMQMKRFKKYINDKEQQQASTSLGDSSSWQGDDAELEAASQAVEDLLNTQELQIRDNPSSQPVRLPSPDSTDEPSQPDPAVRPERSESQTTTQERVTPKERLLPDSLP